MGRPKGSKNKTVKAPKVRVRGGVRGRKKIVLPENEIEFKETSTCDRWMHQNVYAKGASVVQIGQDAYWVLPDGSAVLRYLFGVKKLTAIEVKKLKAKVEKKAEISA